MKRKPIVTVARHGRRCLSALGGVFVKQKLHRGKSVGRGSCKTSVLQEQPLKKARFVALRARNCIASAKLTEFCKRLGILIFLTLCVPLSVFSQDFQMNGTTLVKYNGNAANVTIPAGVTAIGDYAFIMCESLTGITIPASITSISHNAFLYCTSLASITVDINNPTYASEGGIVYNKAKREIIYVPKGIRGAVTIPRGVTSISESAFSDCTSLTSISIPVSVTSIGFSAFQNCTSLTSITIPASVTSIFGGAFGGCTSLTSITIPASVRTMGNPFSGWTARQTIYIQGHASQAAADAAWRGEADAFLGVAVWRYECNARIVYQGR